MESINFPTVCWNQEIVMLAWSYELLDGQNCVSPNFGKSSLQFRRFNVSALISIFLDLMIKESVQFHVMLVRPFWQKTRVSLYGFTEKFWYQQCDDLYVEAIQTIIPSSCVNTQCVWCTYKHTSSDRMQALISVITMPCRCHCAEILKWNMVQYNPKSELYSILQYCNTLLRKRIKREK